MTLTVRKHVASRARLRQIGLAMHAFTFEPSRSRTREATPTSDGGPLDSLEEEIQALEDEPPVSVQRAWAMASPAAFRAGESSEVGAGGAAGGDSDIIVLIHDRVSGRLAWQEPSRTGTRLPRAARFDLRMLECLIGDQDEERERVGKCTGVGNVFSVSNTVSSTRLSRVSQPGATAGEQFGGCDHPRAVIPAGLHVIFGYSPMRILKTLCTPINPAL